MERYIINNIKRMFDNKLNINNIPEDNIYRIQEHWITKFVKKQDEFIKQECIQHLKETNKKVRIFQIDEDKLNYIFDLGLQEYMKERNKI